MGRRKKAAKKVVKKKRPTVAKIFKCLFCNHNKSVSCQLDFKTSDGTLSCSVCDAIYKTKIHDLTQPIDVFTEWLDETAEAQANAAKKFMTKGPPALSRDTAESLVARDRENAEEEGEEEEVVHYEEEE
ncbi:hypothetical protein EON64_10440 [archaeon]|nr:MAG: hypothetical protein EON64_10440 [archaeon]